MECNSELILPKALEIEELNKSSTMKRRRILRRVFKITLTMVAISMQISMAASAKAPIAGNEIPKVSPKATNKAKRLLKWLTRVLRSKPVRWFNCIAMCLSIIGGNVAPIFSISFIGILIYEYFGLFH